MPRHILGSLGPIRKSIWKFLGDRYRSDNRGRLLLYPKSDRQAFLVDRTFLVVVQLYHVGARFEGLGALVLTAPSVLHCIFLPS